MKFLVAVGTPPDEDGSADLKICTGGGRDCGKTHERLHAGGYHKSTVPVGTAKKVKTPVQEELDKREMQPFRFDVASNPEF